MQTNNNLLSVLTREGVLIKVSIRYWRGCKKLKAEDIGLKQADVSDRLISLGHKRLLPKDTLAQLALIEGRAHALVEANTFPFLNGFGHFLPNARLSEVTTKLKELETEFWKAQREFLRKYSSLGDEMLHSINTSETGVHQKTLNRLVRFIDQFKPMNFANDSVMEQQLENVRRNCSPKLPRNIAIPNMPRIN